MRSILEVGSEQLQMMLGSKEYLTNHKINGAIRAIKKGVLS